MFAVAWRHNQNSPWTLLKDPVPSEQDARAEINKYGRYDAVRREYRIIPLGDADTWSDPVAAQVERGAYVAYFPLREQGQ